jgi:hypothetical protein
MPTILISTNVKKKCKNLVTQKSQLPEVVLNNADENDVDYTLDEEFRNDLNSIINKLLVKSNMVRKILVFVLKLVRLRFKTVSKIEMN